MLRSGAVPSNGRSTLGGTKHPPRPLFGRFPLLDAARNPSASDIGGVLVARTPYTRLRIHASSTRETPSPRSGRGRSRVRQARANGDLDGSRTGDTCRLFRPLGGMPQGLKNHGQPPLTCGVEESLIGSSEAPSGDHEQPLRKDHRAIGRENLPDARETYDRLFPARLFGRANGIFSITRRGASAVIRRLLPDIPEPRVPVAAKQDPPTRAATCLPAYSPTPRPPLRLLPTHRSGQNKRCVCGAGKTVRSRDLTECHISAFIVSEFPYAERPFDLRDPHFGVPSWATN